MQLTSSSLLRLGLEDDSDAVRNRESIYLLLDQVYKSCVINILFNKIIKFIFNY